MATTQSSDDGHFASFEDAQTQEIFYFVVGKNKALRYIGGRDPRTGNNPSQSTPAYAGAEAAAVQHFKDQGVL